MVDKIDYTVLDVSANKTASKGQTTQNAEIRLDSVSEGMAHAGKNFGHKKM